MIDRAAVAARHKYKLATLREFIQVKLPMHAYILNSEPELGAEPRPWPNFYAMAMLRLELSVSMDLKASKRGSLASNLCRMYSFM